MSKIIIDADPDYPVYAYPASDVERLVEAAREVIFLIPAHEEKIVALALEKLEAALEPFKGSTGPDS